MTPTGPSPMCATTPDAAAPSRASTTWVAISFPSIKTPSMTITVLLRPSAPAPSASGATVAAAAGSRASAPATPANAATLRKSLRPRSSLCPPQFCTFPFLCRPAGPVEHCFLRTVSCVVDTINYCRRVRRFSRPRHGPYVNIRATIRTVLPNFSVGTQRRSWPFQCRRFSFLSDRIVLVPPLRSLYSPPLSTT